MPKTLYAPPDKLAIREGHKVIVTKDNDMAYVTKATSDPWLLSGHTWVIMLEGISGCYALTHVWPYRELTKGG